MTMLSSCTITSTASPTCMSTPESNSLLKRSPWLLPHFWTLVIIVSPPPDSRSIAACRLPVKNKWYHSCGGGSVFHDHEAREAHEAIRSEVPTSGKGERWQAQAARHPRRLSRIALRSCPRMACLLYTSPSPRDGLLSR